MKHAPSIATILAIAVIALIPTPSVAKDGTAPWWAPRMRAKQTAGDEIPGKAGEESNATAPAKPAPAQPAPAKPVPESTPQAAAAAVLPDPSLTKTIEQIRKSPVGGEPNSAAYLDLIGAGRATAAQVNDFAAYLAKRGMPKGALSFQEYALRLDPANATLWLNLGTIRWTNGSMSAAAAAFKNAIAIDPASALAHYNLGAVYDAEKHYDDAIEEYRRALVLDPDLADPRKNPQVVNNDNLLAVKLQIYSNQAGSLGLPLLQMQQTNPPKKAGQDKP